MITYSSNGGSMCVDFVEPPLTLTLSNCAPRKNTHALSQIKPCQSKGPMLLTLTYVMSLSSRHQYLTGISFRFHYRSCWWSQILCYTEKGVLMDGRKIYLFNIVPTKITNTCTKYKITHTIFRLWWWFFTPAWMAYELSSVQVFIIWPTVQDVKCLKLRDLDICSYWRLLSANSFTY